MAAWAPLLWILFGALLCAAWLCPPEIAWARPGGGQSYRGRSPSGGSGGGGGGELIFLLIRMIFIYPKLGIPVAIVVAVVIWRVRRRGLGGLDSWDTGGVQQRGGAQLSSPQRAASPPLRALFALDPDFSRVVFEDFAYRLYAAAHRARADERALAALAPYLSENVRRSLVAEPPVGVSASRVVVGAMRIDGLRVPDASDQTQREVTLTLHYESNVTVGQAPEERTFYLQESWRLARDRAARTQPPEQTERLGCPSCGAPFESSDTGRCKYCDQVVGNGRFAWLATHRSVLARELRPPSLTSDVAEIGTSRPSIIAPDEAAAWQRLKARDPALSEDDLHARLQLIYATLNQAYSKLDLAPARGMLSDGMFDYLRYWTDAYRAEGLRNVLEQMRITRVQRVKVVCDHYFDAVTFRVWATGIDYTIDVRTQRRLSGSADRPREYSEYWTLIRAAGTHGQPRTDATCPSCAAPLNVSMAGNCNYCGAHITRGEFDWVLSKIEQDEAYEG